MATVKEYQTQLTELYLAFFNRVPDLDGINFWVGHMQSGAHTIASIAKDWWETQAETKAKYPSTLTTAEFVERIYKNVLDRDSDEAGKAFWVKNLDAGNLSRDTFIKDIIDGAKAETGGTVDKAYLANRTEVSLMLLENSDKVGAVHHGWYLSQVDSSSASLEKAKSGIEAFAKSAVSADDLVKNPDKYADSSIKNLIGITNDNIEKVAKYSSKLANGAISVSVNDIDVSKAEYLRPLNLKAHKVIALKGDVTEDNIYDVMQIVGMLKPNSITSVKVDSSSFTNSAFYSFGVNGVLADGAVKSVDSIMFERMKNVGVSKFQDGAIEELTGLYSGHYFNEELVKYKDKLKDNAISESFWVHADRGDTLDYVVALAPKIKDGILKFGETEVTKANIDKLKSVVNEAKFFNGLEIDHDYFKTIKLSDLDPFIEKLPSDEVLEIHNITGAIKLEPLKVGSYFFVYKR